MDNVELEHETGSNLECQVEQTWENIEIEVDSELNADLEVGNEDNSDNFYKPQVAPKRIPKIGQEFKTLDDVKSFYNAYAKEGGFSIRNWSERKKVGSGEIARKEYVCWKQGKSTMIEDVEQKRRRGSVKEDCKEKIAVVLSTSNTYVVSVFVEGHTHPLSTPRKTHFLRSHRNVSSVQKALTQQLGMLNIPQYQQFNLLAVQTGGIENVGCTQKDLYNHERDRRNEMKGHDGDMFNEFMKLEQGKNPSFYFKIESDAEQRITHCFWADAISRRSYSFFGDVVIFYTTYNTNKYGLIFAPLMGVNNHGQTIIFACAFLYDETIDSFVWLFRQFLDAMPGDAPKMIITDQDLAMTNAISQTLPRTFHRYCSWHILTKFSEKIDSTKFNAYYQEFSECVWRSENEEEFDFKWVELIENSGLGDNKWLQSMFEIRSKWVPAHVNHVFSTEISSSQRAESAHAFFKRYVSKKNSLVDFMIQFGRGLVKQRQEELLAEHKDVTEKPKVRMLHDFLVHMIDIFTREMFYKFQDEMWSSLTYKFEFVNEDDNKKVYKIRSIKGGKSKVREICYDKYLDFTSCSCKMFECAGIPCRHMLAYLHKFHDLENLPNQYIMRRWTKTAKSGEVIDSCGIEITDDKSYMLKRNQLIQFSLDVIDKALTSEEATKVYTDALGSALQQINEMVGALVVSAPRSTEMVGCGPSGTVSVNMSSNKEHVYNEPRQVRAKGCGKRLKGGKERALGRAKNAKARRCNGCGLVGQSHDKRNCPILSNTSSAPIEFVTPDDNSDEGYSSPGISLQ